MTLVLDASAVVAALVDGGPDGTWAEPYLVADAAAPHHMPGEAANILRRMALAGQVTDEVTTLAHADLLDLSVALFPYPALAARAWELRHALTIYDGWYVALAELLGAPLVTLDRRLARAHGPRCEVLAPPSA